MCINFQFRQLGTSLIMIYKLVAYESTILVVGLYQKWLDTPALV